METTLQQSLQVFYDNNNFGEEGGIKEDWVWIKFGFVSFPIPNFEQRKKNVWRHDANHILLSYDTSWKGESAVSAWEIGSGGWGNFWIAWGLTLWALGVGVIFFPKSTYKAFVRGRYSLSPYILGIEKEKIFATNISQLREDFKLNITECQANIKDKWMYATWALISVTWMVLPFLTIVCLFYLLSNY